MQADEALKLDYDQTTKLVQSFTDLRTKMLAFVPTITGVAVGLLAEPRPPAELIGIALLGLVAILGIFVYELRNAQHYDALVQRARELERLLGLPNVQGLHGAAGVLASPLEPLVCPRSRLGARVLGRDRGLELSGRLGLPQVDAGRQRADGRRGDRDRRRIPRRRRPRAVSVAS